ncbi:MAG: PTS sugar transporter subunit IIC, partial [bacterium]|nr:PTS sugar transporter subunit IIC [bacterium]
MDAISSLFIISIIGGIVAIDTTAAWQMMISQPVVICPLIGFIFGQPEIGVTLGIILELPWLVNVPSGGKHGSEGNLGAVAAAAIAVYFANRQLNTDNIIIIAAALYAIGVARLGNYLVERVRKINLSLIHRADISAASADMRQ